MEAVYTLCKVDRGVPEVWGSIYDIRDLITAGVKMNDGRMIKDWPIGAGEKAAIMGALKLARNTDLETLLFRLGAAEEKDFEPVIDKKKAAEAVEDVKDSAVTKAVGAAVAVAAGVTALKHLKKK